MRRCIPLPDLPQSAIDSRTIYIEKLPSTASIDHESLSKMFKVFGDVTYIRYGVNRLSDISRTIYPSIPPHSLPRHKSTGDLKGFAFIEFSSQDAADKAVEVNKNSSMVNDKLSVKN